MSKEFPASDYQQFVGKTIASIEDADADEGFLITFTDGSKLDIGFSGCEGTVEAKDE